MSRRILTQWLVTLTTVVALPHSSLLAQELPKSDDSFEVEPPLLVPLSELGGADESRKGGPQAQPDVATLEQRLARAKKNAASSERLVKMGVLAKVEAEQEALRAVRLESELANAQWVAAQTQVTLQQTRTAAGQASKADVDAALEILARASAAAQTAEENYHQAQLETAARNLSRQRQLLALGSAHKSDVARAEEKLDRLQRGDERPGN